MGIWPLRSMTPHRIDALRRTATCKTTAELLHEFCNHTPHSQTQPGPSRKHAGVVRLIKVTDRHFHQDQNTFHCEPNDHHTPPRPQRRIRATEESENSSLPPFKSHMKHPGKECSSPQIVPDVHQIVTRCHRFQIEISEIVGPVRQATNPRRVTRKECPSQDFELR